MIYLMYHKLRWKGKEVSGMGGKTGRLICLIGLLVLLCGCMAQAGESFYALPQLPEDYLSLQNTIDQVMSELGAEYAAPSAGSNWQNIQLQDLDGDGAAESAVAFFRVANAENPLRIYIFRQDPATEEYEVAWVIEGDGTSIYSVAFENLGGSEAAEVVVSWRISSQVQSLSVYSLEMGGEVVELMRSGYTRLAVMDLDRDNEKEIVLVQLDTTENNSRAELYDYDNGLMVYTSSVPLSLNLTAVKSAKTGTLVDSVPALFVSSDYGEAGGRVTDVIALRDGVLTNLTLDSETGMSNMTRRYYKDFQDEYGYDINSDGVLEIPVAETLPLVGGNSAQLYLLHWYQFALDGSGTRVCTTFHSYDDGWYLILPEEWQGKVSVARRESSTGNSTTERAVSFYYCEDWDALNEADPAEAAENRMQTDLQPQEFLTIYRLSGSNRTSRAIMDGRVKLIENTDVIYAAKFWKTDWDCGLDHDELLERFNRVRVNWSENS